MLRNSSFEADCLRLILSNALVQSRRRKAQKHEKEDEEERASNNAPLMHRK